MLHIIEKYKSFFKFCIVGGCATAIDFVLYMLLSAVIPVHAAKTISMICSCTFSFIMNKLWSFEAKDSRTFAEIPKYIITQIVNISLNVGMNSLFLKITGNKIISFVCATGFTMLINFLLQKHFVFKKTKGNETK